MEVFSGEGVDQCTQACGEADVGHRERIGHEFDRRLMMADRKPGAKVHHLRTEAAGRQHCQRDQRGKKGRNESASHQPRCRAFALRLSQQRRQAHDDQCGRRSRQLADDEQRDDVVIGHEDRFLNGAGRLVIAARTLAGLR